METIVPTATPILLHIHVLYIKRGLKMVTII